MSGRQIFSVFLAVAVFVSVLAFMPRTQMNSLVAVMLLMLILWVSGAIPLSATALLPVPLFPFFGIMKGSEVAGLYSNSITFLFIGGFLVAVAMSKHGVHKRIAIAFLRASGDSPNRLILGFMLATAFLSMWISNTATTIMMFAIAMAIIRSCEERFPREHTRNFSVALLLCTAYGANIGGISTLIGTAPNLVFARVFEMAFPERGGVGFAQWMFAALPVVFLMLAIAYIVLTRVFFKVSGKMLSVRTGAAFSKPDAMNSHQKAVSWIFGLTCFLLIFRKDIALGGLVIPGWSGPLPFSDLLDDSTVLVGTALVLFIVPFKNPRDGSGRRVPVLELKDFGEVPWHIIFLLGGGFALAKAMQTTGLSMQIGRELKFFQALPTVAFVAVVCLMMTFLTELTSNTATTDIVLPVIAAISVSVNVDPALLMVPATMSASCAFMLPVATPPNTVVFGSNRIRGGDMLGAGLVLNLAGAAVITLWFYFFGKNLF